MPLRPATVVAIIVLAVSACSHDDPEARRRVDTVATRLDDLERRVATMERSLAPIERLRDETTTLDRRLSALESGFVHPTTPPASVAPGSTTTTTSGISTTTQPPHAAAAPPNPPTRYDRNERREQLRALSDEFRARMAALRDARTPGTMTPEDVKAIQEVLLWHEQQRRTILRGQGRTDQ